MFADSLMSTLHKKRRRRGYKEMMLYIEACESGSMFEGMLGSELGVYATTASNACESSWATYCPGETAAGEGGRRGEGGAGRPAAAGPPAPRAGMTVLLLPPF